MKKKRALEAKETRKREREMKKIGKNKRGDTSEEEELMNEDQIPYDDSDEDFRDEVEGCEACGGNDRADEVEAWIGCSSKQCGFWFHRTCISDEISKMSFREIKKLPWYCKTCEKKRKSCGKKLF